MKKGINLLELLFAAFLTLHLMGVQPFAGWKWYTIAIVLFVEVIVRLLKKLWYGYGLDKVLYERIEMMRYDALLKREVNKAKAEIKAKYGNDSKRS